MAPENMCERCNDLLHCHWIREIASEANESLRPEVVTHIASKTSDVDDSTALRHHSWNDLESSALAGCPLCQLFLDARGQWGTTCPQRDEGIQADIRLFTPEMRIELLYPHGVSYLQVVKTILRNPRETTSRDARLHADSGRDGLQIPPEQTLSAIKSFLSQCHQEHSQCRKWAENGRASAGRDVIPDRLLRVSKHETGYSLRLMQTDTLAQGLAYATLSHCWGDSVPLQLTTDTILDMQEGIDIFSLPQTFRDAVHMTDLLGIELLWIDALCIVQDSHEDWAKEAPKMTSIYSQSYVNLAATASSDSTGGLFCQKSFEGKGPLELSVRWWIDRQPYSRHAFFVHFDWYEAVVRAPLNQRAWVLQEKLIPPRTIHFAQNQVWWICQELLGSEFGPPYRHEYQLGVTDHWALHNEAFMGLVDSYSSRALSRPSDRLMALSGLAQLFAYLYQRNSEDYMAGLWRTELPEALEWYCYSSCLNANNMYIAPSWSWASVGTSVGGHCGSYYGDNILLKIIEAEVTAADKNRFGSVTEGRLVCEGVLLPLQVNATTAYLPDERNVLATSIGGSPSLLLVDGFPECQFAADAHLDHGALRMDFAWEKLSEGSLGVWFLPILWRDEDGGEGHIASREYMREIRGILLRRVEAEVGCYRRVGFLTCCQDKQRWNEDHWSMCRLSEGDNVKDLGNGKYQFHIK